MSTNQRLNYVDILEWVEASGLHSRNAVIRQLRNVQAGMLVQQRHSLACHYRALSWRSRNTLISMLQPHTYVHSAPLSLL